MDDSTLLRCFVEHRREADFAELVSRHLGLVYRVALRRTAGDTHLAEDISQQVFTVLSQRAVSVQDHPVLQGWLYVTTCNLAAKAVRGEQRRRHREQEANAMNEFTVLPEAEPEPDLPRLRAELGRVLDALSERDRHAVLLRFYSNQPYAEIGAVLKVSENAARQRVDRALERMRKLFARRRIVSTSAALAALLTGEAAAAVPSGLAGTVTTAALAGGVAAAPAGVLYFLQLMGTTKTMASVAGAVVCLATGVAVYENYEGRAAQTENVAALEENRALAREVRLANSQLDEATRRKRQAELASEAARKRMDELAAMQPTSAAAATKPNEKAKVMDARQVRMQLMLTNPEYLSAMIEMQRMGLHFQYGALYKKLRLTPQQIADFEEATAAYSKTTYDIQAAAFAQGIGSSQENDPVREAYCQPKILEAKTQLWTHIREMLGESGYKELQANYQYEDARLTTNQLVKDLFYSTTPLTVIQADAMTGLLSRNSSSVNSSLFQNRKFDWDAVFAQAPAVLTTPQVAVLKQRVEAARLNQELWSFMAQTTKTAP
jgi:RNA polymerase sigma factor (sigma-70 family)